MLWMLITVNLGPLVLPRVLQLRKLFLRNLLWSVCPWWEGPWALETNTVAVVDVILTGQGRSLSGWVIRGSNIALLKRCILQTNGRDTVVHIPSKYCLMARNSKTSVNTLLRLLILCTAGVISKLPRPQQRNICAHRIPTVSYHHNSRRDSHLPTGTPTHPSLLAPNTLGCMHGPPDPSTNVQEPFPHRVVTDERMVVLEMYPHLKSEFNCEIECPHPKPTDAHTHHWLPR